MNDDDKSVSKHLSETLTNSFYLKHPVIAGRITKCERYVLLGSIKIFKARERISRHKKAQLQK